MVENKMVRYIKIMYKYFFTHLEYKYPPVSMGDKAINYRAAVVPVIPINMDSSCLYVVERRFFRLFWIPVYRNRMFVYAYVYIYKQINA